MLPESKRYIRVLSWRRPAYLNRTANNNSSFFIIRLISRLNLCSDDGEICVRICGPGVPQAGENMNMKDTPELGL